MNKKIVLITGSLRGIGRTIAVEFLRKGYFVLINGRKNYEEIGNKLIAFEEYGNSYDYFKFDISNREEVQVAIDKIINKYGKIDILVNNAGITSDKSMVKLDNYMWDEVINVNLTGTYNVTREVVPNMIENSYGRVINISSVIALSGNFGQSNYSASKAGVIGFTKSLAQEVAKYGITVNAVAPGFIKTDMTEVLADKTKEALLNNIPMKRLGEPNDIAELAGFLASDAASYITGQVINVDGGMAM